MTQLSAFSLETSFRIIALLSLVLIGGAIACAALTYWHHVLATRGHPAQRWFPPRYGRQLNPEAVHAKKAIAWALAMLTVIAALVGLHVHLNQEFWPLAAHGVRVDVEVQQLTRTEHRSRHGTHHVYTVVGVTSGSGGHESLVPMGFQVSDTVSREVFGRLHEHQLVPFVVLPSDPLIHQVGTEASLRGDVLRVVVFVFIGLILVAALSQLPTRR